MLKRFCCALCAGLLIQASAQAQVVRSGTTLQSGTNHTACTGDKIQFTDFAVTPTNPAADQNVTVQFKIRNLCSTALDVPYRIYDGSTMKSSGTKSVSGKQVAAVQYTMAAAPGTHAIDAYLDHGNTLKEPSAHLANNGALDAISFTVAPPPMETRLLIGEEAQQAGAQFLTAEAVPPCFFRSVGASSSSSKSSAYATLEGPPGCSAGTYEMFKNFTLKNGWKIKSIYFDTGTRRSFVNADWEWLTRPSEGSTSAYGRFRLRAKNTALPTHAPASVIIHIEGPKGTNPYF
ncbi:MAG: hypothetical protein ACT443_04100 [Gemmatimonadota bacterium]